MISAQRLLTDRARTIGVEICCGEASLNGTLAIPLDAKGMVLFAHGPGSSRHSPRNEQVARTLNDRGFGTLLFDLLSLPEEIDRATEKKCRFDIPLLASRLVAATKWISRREPAERLGIGYFGSYTGGAAALVAAAEIGSPIDAVVCRSGRLDLAGESLSLITAPTLLIVPEKDEVVWEVNDDGYRLLKCKKDMKIVRGATHLYEEPGALEEVGRLAAGWFRKYLHPR